MSGKKSDGSWERRTLSDDRRGQTLQDFVTGVSLFILVVTFVLTVFPSFLAPFSTGVGGAEQAQADRVGRVMISNLSVVQGQNTLNATELKTVLEKNQTELRRRYGLGETTFINITVRELDGNRIVRDPPGSGVRLASPKHRQNQSAASVARIVSLHNGTCQPGCRLVVKVW